MLHHHCSWICALDFSNSVLLLIFVVDLFLKREDWEKNRILFFFLINALNKRHISHHEVNIEWCTNERITKVFVKPLFNL